jgi:site-specific DNA-methyltransferase (adenine-specific)
VYCSKTANGPYSICDTFADEQGNIRYERMPHSWESGKCTYCGASQEVYDRDDALETYAYPFIHTNISKTLFENMTFDVVVGNPPYQLSDGGAQMSASPIYHKFIQQAKKLNPKYLSMIVPARWYAGGKGLDDFREEMLNDGRIKEIHDFHETSDVFPGLNIRGGICYFLWEKDYKGDCTITNYNKGQTSTATRPLLESQAKIFVRYNKAISILRKVQELKEKSFSDFVSSHKAFGLRTYVKGHKEPFENAVKLYQNGGIGYIKREEVVKNQKWIDEFKVIIPYSSPGDDSFPHLILSKPKISEPNSCSTETYLVVGPFSNQKKCENICIYLRSKLVRFLILLLKPTQHVTQKTYQFVPIQDFNEPWTDEKLYKKYGITEEEIAFIDSMIRPMELNA